MARSKAMVEVKGAKELRASLKKAGADMSDLKDANQKTAQIVANAGRSGSPQRSGALAASIRGNRAAASAVVKAGGKAVPYAGVIHYGWKSRNIAAQPWLFGAAQQTEAEWTAAYEQDIDAILAKVKGD